MLSFCSYRSGHQESAEIHHIVPGDVRARGSGARHPLVLGRDGEQSPFLPHPCVGSQTTSPLCIAKRGVHCSVIPWAYFNLGEGPRGIEIAIDRSSASCARARSYWCNPRVCPGNRKVFLSEGQGWTPLPWPGRCCMGCPSLCIIERPKCIVSAAYFVSHEIYENLIIVFCLIIHRPRDGKTRPYEGYVPI